MDVFLDKEITVHVNVLLESECIIFPKIHFIAVLRPQLVFNLFLIFHQLILRLVFLQDCSYIGKSVDILGHTKKFYIIKTQ